MSDPMYRQFPELYAYNTESKKHMLRTGRAYKKAFAEHPEHFVDSSSMFRTIAKPIPEAVRGPVAQAKIESQPEPEAKLETPSPAPITKPVKPKPSPELRQQVKAVIQTEVKANPAPYVGKNKAELDSLFRALLLQKLSESKPKFETASKITKPKKQGHRAFKFRLAKSQISTDEDEEDDDEEDDEDELSEGN